MLNRISLYTVKGIRFVGFVEDAHRNQENTGFSAVVVSVIPLNISLFKFNFTWCSVTGQSVFHFQLGEETYILSEFMAEEQYKAVNVDFVFVFGAVKKPGAITMPNGILTLAQALSSAGVEESRDDDSRIRIIRSHSPTSGELLVVDVGRVLRGETLPFPLQQGDIIYVPRGVIGSWNQALAEILPTLQTVSAILEPFVQIEYLQNN